jgi:hypothetical protein
MSRGENQQSFLNQDSALRMPPGNHAGWIWESNYFVFAALANKT